YDIVSVVTKLKNDGLKFYVASNAIRNTIELGLKKLGIFHLVDKIYSNQDVARSKPNPEMYLRCMADAGVNPSETLI
ncbi:HAD hydrolase-like protein, partial [Bacillus cereus]|uniref:HAD family hydrolase n=1 Tax=Bacillus cereus TaxID=1396 RepID=UPI0018F60971